MIVKDVSTRNAQICMLYDLKFSYSKIAEKCGVSKTTVCNTVKRYIKTNSFERKRGSGRKKSLSDDDICFIEKNIEDNSKISAPKMRDMLSMEKGIHVSVQTIRNVLKNKGYSARIARKIPLLSKKM